MWKFSVFLRHAAQSVFFSTKCHFLHKFHFFWVQRKENFINHALQFKYPAQWDKGAGLLHLMLVSVTNYFALVNDHIREANESPHFNLNF